jgi:putative transposase
MLGISKQSVHQHNQRKLAFEARVTQLLIEVDILRSEHPGCGVEKMYYTLRPDWIGRDRFIVLLIQLGYRVKKSKSFTRTTISSCYQYANLIEGMLLWDKNQLWQSDITFFRVQQEYYYLVFITDVYTKRILGYQVSDHLRAQANLAALKMAIKNAGDNINNLIHHSDRGSQYGEREYTSLLIKNGAHISMGRKAQGNAYAERVNGIIKNEYLDYRIINSLTALKKYTRLAVNHYNSKRIHYSLPDRMTPDNFDKNLIYLSGQKRPKVIVYAEGNPRIKEASNLLDSLPEKNLQAHVCPMVMKVNSE